MKLEYIRNLKNDSLILNSIHPDFKGSDGSFLEGGRITYLHELSDESYFSKLSYAFRISCKENVATNLASIFEKHEGLSLKEARETIQSQMNQWLDSKGESIKKFFEAFSIEASKSTLLAIDEMKCTFPSQIDYKAV
ncbi:hypothetical protein DFP77_13513 [Marinomonas foliarum]|uniref:Uncharacterized protein n=2 Tax=Marinomonas foliarum TaxID=491950 RepID=A0A368ZPL0_9GAMM|nr:hypothetical protein DFP77_13513 [Marinomonas foliarum]